MAAIPAAVTVELITQATTLLVRLLAASGRKAEARSVADILAASDATLQRVLRRAIEGGA